VLLLASLPPGFAASSGPGGPDGPLQCDEAGMIGFPSARQAKWVELRRACIAP
jgi:hypothetical protein